jgi:hypothetical protein
LALKKISSIRQISGLLKPVEGKFIQVQKDVGNDNTYLKVALQYTCRNHQHCFGAHRLRCFSSRRQGCLGISNALASCRAEAT